MKTLIGFVTGAALLLIAMPVSAATISDARFSNNQTSIDATGGSTVSGTFTLTVGPGEVVEWLRATPVGHPATPDVSVGGTLGYQEGIHYNIPFSVKMPQNTVTTVNVDVQGAGMWGGNRSINAGDNVVVGPTNVGTVRVVATAPSTTPAPGDTSGLVPFTYKGKTIQVTPDMKVMLELLLGEDLGNSNKPAYCASMPSASASTLTIQGWLVDHGFMTQTQVNTGPGIYGPKTSAAHADAKRACL